MKLRGIHIGWVMALLTVLSGCMKETAPGHQSSSWDMESQMQHAVATLRSQNGVRYLQLDPVSKGWIVNPEAVSGIPDVTRLFVQYDVIRAEGMPSFCTEPVRVDWATPLDVGSVSLGQGDIAYTSVSGDPVDVVSDWVTSLEDGFLTVHYSAPVSGNKKHSFLLCKGASPYAFYFVHDAHGDEGGALTDGIVCFPVEEYLPDTGGKTGQLSLEYINLQNKTARLTIDYTSSK